MGGTRRREIKASILKCGETPIECRGGAAEVDLCKSCGVCMCDGTAETVKYLWVNTWCMLDWNLPYKAVEIHYLCIYRWLTSKECKNLDAVVFDQLVAANLMLLPIR